MKNNHNFYDNLKNMSNGTLSEEDIRRAKNGDVSSLIDKLPDSDADKIRDILSSSEKRKQFLSSPAAKKILEMLGGKNNG